MQGIASRATEIVREYLLRKYQPEWCEEHNIQSLSFTELVEKMYQEDPAIAHEIASLILRGFIKTASEQQDSRRAYIEEVNSLFDVAPLRVLSSSLPDTTSSFTGFKLHGRTPSVRHAHRATKLWTQKKGPPLLVLAGAPGVGKSHLSLSAARILQRVGATFIYTSEANMLSELRRHIQTGNLDETLNDLSNVPWLFIEDLGLSAATDWGRSILDKLIDDRWQNSSWARTMISTNLFKDQLPPRLASRLADARLSTVCTLKDSDYRLNMGGVL